MTKIVDIIFKFEINERLLINGYGESSEASVGKTV